MLKRVGVGLAQARYRRMLPAYTLSLRTLRESHCTIQLSAVGVS